jgi:hypothetical protein
MPRPLRPARAQAGHPPALPDGATGGRATVRLRFAIDSEVRVEKPMLALENADRTVIELNGKKAESAARGWYVDKCIRTVELPRCAGAQRP